jgi:hypothetical protein
MTLCNRPEVRWPSLDGMGRRAENPLGFDELRWLREGRISLTIRLRR